MLLIGIVSVTILIFQQLSMDTMDYLEKENYSAAVEQFNKQAEPLDEETRQAFQDAVETLKNLYITGEIDYNQTKQSLDLLKEVHDSSLQAFITAAEEEVAAVKSGREHYEDGETISKENEHAVSSLQNGETSNVVDQTIQDFEQALDDFSSVSEKDVAYYEKATASFQKTLEQYQTYLLAASDSYQKQEDYESAYALLNNVPQMRTRILYRPAPTGKHLFWKNGWMHWRRNIFTFPMVEHCRSQEVMDWKRWIRPMTFPPKYRRESSGRKNIFYH